jgi:hypothetical protein
MTMIVMLDEFFTVFPNCDQMWLRYFAADFFSDFPANCCDGGFTKVNTTARRTQVADTGMVHFLQQNAVFMYEQT